MYLIEMRIHVIEKKEEQDDPCKLHETESVHVVTRMTMKCVYYQRGKFV